MARIATVARMPPPFRRRTTKKEPQRSARSAVTLDERIEEIMDRVQKAGHNQVERVERVAALEEDLTLARAHEGETWSDAGARTEDLADSYLALGRIDDAVRAVSDATRSGHAGGAEMPCELAEKLMRSGYEPQARLLWQQARAGYPDDVSDLCAGWHRDLCAGWHRVWRHRQPRQSPGVADHRARTGVAHR